MLDAVFPPSKPSLPLGLAYVAASRIDEMDEKACALAINGGKIGRTDQECGSFFSRMLLGDLGRHPQIAASNKLTIPGPNTYKPDKDPK